MKIPTNELVFSFSRSSGKGGQNVNKVNTKVLLEWNIKKSKKIPKTLKERFISKYKRRIKSEEIVQITSQRYRNQAQNIADCVDKLSRMLDEVKTPPKKRIATKPTKSSINKRLRQKKQLSEKKRIRGEKW